MKLVQNPSGSLIGCLEPAIQRAIEKHTRIGGQRPAVDLERFVDCPLRLPRDRVEGDEPAARVAMVRGEHTQGGPDIRKAAPVFHAERLVVHTNGNNVILLFSQWRCVILPVGNPINDMKEKADVLQGTLALMVLKTLDVLGSLHGYGIARRIEQISGDLLTVNQGTLYPVLLKLEQEGSIASEWNASENNRKARFYRLTRGGRKQLQAETRGWEQTAAIIGRFFAAKAEDFQ